MVGATLPILTAASQCMLLARRRGDSDFSKYAGRPPRSEAIRKGSAFLVVWMEFVRLLHEAVAFCEDGKHSDAARSVDKAVVFYAGSQVKEKNNPGVLLFGLAEAHADATKPVAHKVNPNVTGANVNVQVFNELKAIKEAVTEESKACRAADKSRKEIVNWMKIPLVQGVVFYAYQREKGVPVTDDKNEQMKYEQLQANGATFAATLLPWIHVCDESAAETIHANMQMGAATKFQDVNTALIQTYDCMNVSCVEVGGVWNKRNGDYEDGALPCGVTETAQATSFGYIVRSFLNVLLGVAIAGILSM
jgi:hypothetical protein